MVEEDTFDWGSVAIGRALVVIGDGDIAIIFVYGHLPVWITGWKQQRVRRRCSLWPIAIVVAFVGRLKAKRPKLAGGANACD